MGLIVIIFSFVLIAAGIFLVTVFRALGRMVSETRARDDITCYLLVV